MRTKKQKKILILYSLIGLSALFMLIGFIVVLSPVNFTFDMNYGDSTDIGETIAPITKLVGGKLSLPTPIRPGYRFVGWTADGETAVLQDNLSAKIVTKITKKKMKLYAIWEKIYPVISLYVDGYYLRDVVLTPSLVNNLTNNGDTNFLVSDWSNDLVSSIPILNAYAINQFKGWYYNDDNGVHIELRYSIGTWSVYKQDTDMYGQPSSQNLSLLGVLSSNPLKFTTNVSFNAMFGSYDFTNNIGNTGISLGIRVYNQDSTTYTSSDQLFFGSTYNLSNLQKPVSTSFVGWKMSKENSVSLDGFDHTYDFDIIPKDSENLYLDPIYYDACSTINGALTLSLYPIIVSSSGTYEKTINNGLISFPKYSAGVFGVTINDQTKRNLLTVVNGKQIVQFNYNNGKIKNISELQGNGYLPSEKRAVSFSVYNERVMLPTVIDLAVAGQVFEGWQAYAENKNIYDTNGNKGKTQIIDSKIYPGGLEYRIPRGTTSLKFTAVWVDARRHVSFDGDGVNIATNEKNYYFTSGNIIQLPNPGKRFGYDFVGWQNRSTGNIIPYNSNVPMTCTIQQYEQKFVAQWNSKPVNVSITPIGGETIQRTCDFGSVLILERSSVTQKGWKLGSQPKWGEFDFVAIVDSVQIVIDDTFCFNYSGAKYISTFFQSGSEPDIYATGIE